MLRIEYDPAKIWVRIIPFQIIPLVLILYTVGLVSGAMQATSPVVAQVAITAGFALYALFMILLVNSLRNPIVLSIDADRIIKWRPAFKEWHTQLPTGTRVSYNNQEIIITPQVPDMPVSKLDNQSTIVKLPQGLRIVKDGEIVLA